MPPCCLLTFSQSFAVSNLFTYVTISRQYYFFGVTPLSILIVFVKCKRELLSNKVKDRIEY